jgi:hypothetical protein
MSSKWLTVALAAILLGYYFGPGAQRFFTVVGILRAPKSTPLAADDFVAIEDTVLREDLHLHEPSGMTFSACDDTEDWRYTFSPPIAILGRPEGVLQAKGSIHVIDPKVRVL